MGDAIVLHLRDDNVCVCVMHYCSLQLEES